MLPPPGRSPASALQTTGPSFECYKYFLEDLLSQIYLYKCSWLNSSYWHVKQSYLVLTLHLMLINIFLEKPFLKIIYLIVLGSVFLHNEILSIYSVFQYKTTQNVLFLLIPLIPLLLFRNEVLCLFIQSTFISWLSSAFQSLIDISLIQLINRDWVIPVLFLYNSFPSRKRHGCLWLHECVLMAIYFPC